MTPLATVSAASAISRAINGRICSVPGCCRPHQSRSFCDKHYRRWRVTGDPLKTKATPRGELQCFLENVALSHDNKKDCLIWPYGRTQRGYASIQYKGKTMFASRAICILAHGAPPSESHVAAHSCGNGRGGCINPHHIRWATTKENHADRYIHGTMPRGEKNGRKKLTAAQVIEIRQRIKNGERNCDLAQEFGVDRTNISHITLGRSWGWL